MGCSVISRRRLLEFGVVLFGTPAFALSAESEEPESLLLLYELGRALLKEQDAEFVGQASRISLLSTPALTRACRDSVLGKEAIEDYKNGRTYCARGMILPRSEALLVAGLCLRADRSS